MTKTVTNCDKCKKDMESVRPPGHEYRYEVRLPGIRWRDICEECAIKVSKGIAESVGLEGATDGYGG